METHRELVGYPVTEINSDNEISKHSLLLQEFYELVHKTLAHCPVMNTEIKKVKGKTKQDCCDYVANCAEELTDLVNMLNKYDTRLENEYKPYVDGLVNHCGNNCPEARKALRDILTGFDSEASLTNFNIPYIELFEPNTRLLHGKYADKMKTIEDPRQVHDQVSDIPNAFGFTEVTGPVDTKASYKYNITASSNPSGISSNYEDVRDFKDPEAPQNQNEEGRPELEGPHEPPAAKR